MKNTVMIKGTKSGIILVLDQDARWTDLKKQVAEKFKASSDFLGNAKKAISFQGRQMDDAQQNELLDIIHENCKLQIICVMEEDPEKEEVFAKAVSELSGSDVEPEEEQLPVSSQSVLDSDTGFFFKGNLRSGQVLDVETSIVILGDVKAGAKVVSKGNVIILGSLKGNVFAGSAGNENAFVVALDMSPMQIRIADTIARSPDGSPKKEKKGETKIAFWEDGNIYIEPLDKDVLGDIRLS